MIYRIDFTDVAKSDIAKLKRSEPKAYKKLLQLLDELQIHPYFIKVNSNWRNK
jgi:toxin YoeB